MGKILTRAFTYGCNLVLFITNVKILVRSVPVSRRKNENLFWNSWEFYYCNCWNVFRWCDQNADSFKLTWHITLRSVFQFSMRHGILVYKRIWTAPSRISSIRLGFVKGVRHANVYILHFKNINPTPLFFEIVFVTIQV